jgi:hypothetical protein
MMSLLALLIDCAESTVKFQSHLFYKALFTSAVVTKYLKHQMATNADVEAQLLGKTRELGS